MLELLTADEVSEMFKVSRNTIDTWVARKVIPDNVMIKMSGRKSPRRFIKERLEEWILNGCLQA